MSEIFPEQLIIRRIEKLLHRLKSTNDSIVGQYPKNDLRPALIGLPGNTLQSFLFLYAMVDHTICRKEWWQVAYGKDGPNELDREAVNNLEKNSRHSFFVFFLSRQEWNFRILISYLRPTSNVKGSSFQNVYEAVLKDTDLQQFLPLFEVSRLFRNTIHSNGIHISKDRQDRTIEWKQQVFDFRFLEPISFASTDICLDLVEDHIEVIEMLLKCQAVIGPTYLENKLQ